MKAAPGVTCRTNWGEAGQLSMTETRKSMSGCPSAKLLTGLTSPNQMDGQGDRQLFTRWTAGLVLSESFAWLLGESWSGVEGGIKSWVCCPWWTAHLAVSMCLWKIWLEMDAAADRVAPTQTSIVLKGWEQGSSPVGTEHSLSDLLLFSFSFVSSIL